MMQLKDCYILWMFQDSKANNGVFMPIHSVNQIKSPIELSFQNQCICSETAVHNNNLLNNIKNTK